MDVAFPDYDYDADLLSSSDQHKTDLFLFNSSQNLVRARGVSQTLETPLSAKTFQHDVQRVFDAEKMKGIDNPILVGAIPFDLDQPCHLLAPKWSERVKPFSANFPAFKDKDFAHHVLSHSFTPDHNNFVKMIEEALVTLGHDDLKKIVLSKTLDLTLDKSVDIPRLLTNIMGQNPNAYHFSVPLETGILIGASPELLIRKEGSTLYSNPLAGSAKRSKDQQEDRRVSQVLQQSKKDQYEHRIVVDAIRSALIPMVQSMKLEEQPSLISTPTMWHLSTQIEAILASDSGLSIFDVIKRLHPTPAMCGTPTGLAHDHIAALEPHQRGFFSGLVGWCDAQGNGEWAIAIRCAEVASNKVRLFAGAGVVPDSCVESEWRETSAKMQTMINAFGIKDFNNDD
ncbi:isochorismate synthase [Marinomonas sp. TW1]|uniref:isochorismate synthase n=1 Tax=Marinomonas sp. TW1 TaxID=1561203 RepID=UPI0007AF05AB|nr:isochorismate synthase [Marinomonas sp. TW1]